ncbi:hypothetical protein ACFQ61_08180 [Streptomyces sp. NPDC056500]|uniref:hypothetical protein n=1 Tax=Streptomyces sp. NPDC056500 TaxID=3345840 RepID=UPI0036A8E564
MKLLYRDLAHLVGGYVGLFGGVFSHNTADDRPILYVETPTGQCSWSICPEDLDALDGLAIPTVEDYPWDGHTTVEKQLRLVALNQKLPKMTYSRPEYGSP